MPSHLPGSRENNSIRNILAREAKKITSKVHSLKKQLAEALKVQKEIKKLQKNNNINIESQLRVERVDNEFNYNSLRRGLNRKVSKSIKKNNRLGNLETGNGNRNNNYNLNYNASRRLTFNN